jgi:hypothetical protein
MEPSDRLDPSEPVYPLNRAATLMKLERYVHLGLVDLESGYSSALSFRHAEAERDCDLVLSLDPQSFKAALRRALAKKALGRTEEAQKGQLNFSCEQDSL